MHSKLLNSFFHNRWSLASLSKNSSDIIPLSMRTSMVIENIYAMVIENIYGDLGFFSTFFLKYLTCCITHCFTAGGNKRLNVHVIILQTIEWCKFHICWCLKRTWHSWVPELVQTKLQSWLSRLLQTISKGHYSQLMVASSVQYLITTGLKSFNLITILTLESAVAPTHTKVSRKSFRKLFERVTDF